MSNEPNEEIAALERAAEEAYTQMYDAPRHRVRECYEDASANLARAIEIAKVNGMSEIADRLKARKDHIYNVYTHQFR